MIWLIGIGIALAVSACSNSWTDDGSGRPRRRDAGPDAPPPPPPDGGVADSPPESIDARSQCPREGYSVIAHPQGAEGTCPIVDFEIKSLTPLEEELFGQCGPPLNRTFNASFDNRSPMSPVRANIGDRVPPYTSGRSDFNVPYSIDQYAEGCYFIPNNTGEAPFVGAVTLMSPSYDARTTAIPSFPSTSVPPVTYAPQKIVGFAEESSSAGGRRAFIAGANANQSGRGIVFSVPIASNGNLNLGNIGTPTGTNGTNPVAIGRLDGNMTAVVNESCQPGGRPCVDVVDRSNLGGMRSIVEPYPLSISGIISSHRIAKTADNRYLVNASPSGEISIVDRQSRSEIGLFSVAAEAETRPVRFSAVKDMKAYLSATDRIFIVDFSNPSTPRLEKEICVGKDLGPIGVHSSGTIIIAITDFCGEGTNGGNHWTDLVAIDPNSPVHEPCPVIPDGGTPDIVPVVVK